MPVVKNITIVETNGAGRIQCLVPSGSDLPMQTEKSWKLMNSKLVFFLRTILTEIFLPQGYPLSVSSDYWDYQVWDTLQAFCSTICGTLTTHAIFKGVGVGDSDATALAATVTWILKDGTGMISRMGFTWWKGFLLDTDCKKWRLVADVVNDGAMSLELLLGSAFFKNYRSILLCLSTTMRAVVGVAGGATRAAITQHQAIRNNVADVSAKDGSQETCVNLIASCLGIFLLTKIESNTSNMWILFVLVIGLHIFANYKAVKSLKMRTLNASRLILLMKHFLHVGEVASFDKINREESVVLGLGTTEIHLIYAGGQMLLPVHAMNCIDYAVQTSVLVETQCIMLVIPEKLIIVAIVIVVIVTMDYDLCRRKIYLGYSLKKVIEKQEQVIFDSKWLESRKTTYQALPYFITYDYRALYVILQENITDQDVIMAWFHAVILGIILHSSSNIGQKFRKYYNSEFRTFLETYRGTSASETKVNQFVRHTWQLFISDLLAKGWIVNQHQLIVGDWRVKWNSKFN